MCIKTMVGMAAYAELVHALDRKNMTTLTLEYLLELFCACYATCCRSNWLLHSTKILHQENLTLNKACDLACITRLPLKRA